MESIRKLFLSCKDIFLLNVQKECSLTSWKLERSGGVGRGEIHNFGIPVENYAVILDPGVGDTSRGQRSTGTKLLNCTNLKTRSPG